MGDLLRDSLNNSATQDQNSFVAHVSVDAFFPRPSMPTETAPPQRNNVAAYVHGRRARYAGSPFMFRIPQRNGKRPVGAEKKPHSPGLRIRSMTAIVMGGRMSEDSDS